MTVIDKVTARPGLHEPAVVKGRGEAFGEGGGDERSRIAREQQLGIARGSERGVRAFQNSMHVGGLARDRQLVRQAPDRPPRLRGGKRRAVDDDLLRAKLYEDSAGR